MKAIAQTICLGFTVAVISSCCYRPTPLPLGPPLGPTHPHHHSNLPSSGVGPAVDPRLSTENAQKFFNPSPYVNRKDFDGDRRSHAFASPVVIPVSHYNSGRPSYFRRF
ncbi:MAG: hypothetical protein U0984_15865 [Prosthecobacter sp.]|nr:hypothetical protein [Prosthecobacter sp.]